MTFPRFFLSAASFLLVVSGLACSPVPEAGPVDDHEEELSTRYGDLWVTLDGEELERWVDVRGSLKSGFDRICGDTICGGDFSNLSTVQLTCSSTTVARKMKDCAWVLGGSIESVDANTGAIVSESRAFTCKVPVAATAKTLLDTLSAAGDDALFTPLPRTNGSFYDALVSCFAGVQGPALPESPAQARYRELSDWLWETGTTQGETWFNVRQALARDFDHICGDTFCEGDYSSIEPLRFACAVNTGNRQVTSCSWSFAGAAMSVNMRGAVEPETMTRRCSVEVDSDVDTLVQTLSASREPLYAKLPGKTYSIYEALIGCL